MRVKKFEVRSLSVQAFDEAIGRHRSLLSDMSFSLRSGQGLGITGESGAGKTTLALALGGLLPADMEATAERFELVLEDRGRELGFRAAGRLPAPLRGRATFTLFQEPRASLNPYRTIGSQLNRCARQGGRNDGAKQTSRRTLQALQSVGLSSDVASRYTHELSTGMCQRVFLAMSSLLDACVLLADEPFASVDAATRNQLTEALRHRMHRDGLVVILVTHDLALLRKLTHQTIVMYRGEMAEIGPTERLLCAEGAVHPYTWLLKGAAGLSRSEELLPGGAGGGQTDARCWYAGRCRWADSATCLEPVPRFRTDADVGKQAGGPESGAPCHQARCVKHPIEQTRTHDLSEPGWRHGASAELPAPGAVRSDGGDEIVRVTDLAVEYRTGWFHGHVQRVFQGVSLTISPGERLGVVGPNGRGKTTLARVVAGLLRPASGRVQIVQGGRRIDVRRMSPWELSRLREGVQLVYQDAELLLDPADRVGQQLVEAYRVFDSGLSRQRCYRLAGRLLQQLALGGELLEAYPYRLSGGERKRVAVARCFAALGCPFPARREDPTRLLILDEPTSGLDVVLQVVLSRFLLWAQRRLRLSYLVISHDEAFIRGFCHRAFQLGENHVSVARAPQ